MDKNKKDYLISTISYQLVICILLFGTVFLFKKTNTDFYKTINDEFYDKISENIIIQSSPKSEEQIQTNKETTETTVREKATESETSVRNIDNKKNNKNSITKSRLSAKVNNNSETSLNILPANVSVNNYEINKTMVSPVIGEITSSFGYRNHPVYNEEKFHAGVDIAAAEGSPIYSGYDGEVFKATYDQWNGNYVKIKHQGNIMTVYCHCKSLNVTEGQKIKAGDVIGYVGSTGISTGPHLHFELRINNISYNPETVLKTAKNAV